MAKKRLISSILLCAFAVIFAHSIIPHHHHHHEEERTAQHQGSHDDDDHEDIDHNFLDEAFSKFQHEQEGGIIYETTSLVHQYSKVNLEKYTGFLVQYIVQVLHKPPIENPEPYKFNFSSSSYSDTSLLRGPPLSLA